MDSRGTTQGCQLCPNKNIDADGHKAIQSSLQAASLLMMMTFKDDIAAEV
jgi:hypothetical protein